MSDTKPGPTRTFRFVAADPPELVSAAEAEREADEACIDPNPYRGAIERLERYRSENRARADRLTFRA